MDLAVISHPYSPLYCACALATIIATDYSMNIKTQFLNYVSEESVRDVKTKMTSYWGEGG